MKKILIILTLLFTTACANIETTKTNSDKLKVVTTTTMIYDLVKNIGQDNIEVVGLMQSGVDPHLYKASANDVNLIQNADIVVYHGLHLEGQMGDIFSNLKNNSIKIEDGIDINDLLTWDDESSLYDPHIWFDIDIWIDATKYVGEQLAYYDKDNAEIYLSNTNNYIEQLKEADSYIKEKANEIPIDKRYLVTAHDAFQYFGNAYDFNVVGLQGISTESEAATSDISNLADFIVENKIKAIFIETSVPTKTIEALQAAVKAKGFDTIIGGELYSDSLGDKENNTDTYITTVKANIDTIVEALK
jgi:manganese/zinc/iron transport system substrate-binding protein